MGEEGGGSLMNRKERRDHDAGTSMVELSIVLTLVFLPLIYGLITFGYAFSIRENMTHAAQEALRQAIINAQSSSNGKPDVLACTVENDARSRMAGSVGKHSQATVTDPLCASGPYPTQVSPSDGGLDISTDYNGGAFSQCPNGPAPSTTSTSTTSTTAAPQIASNTCITVTMVYQYHRFPIIAPLPGIFDLLPQTLKVSATERLG